MIRLVLALLLIASPAFAQRPNHTDAVASAQADLRAAGLSLDGECGAFRVVNLAAWRLRQAGEADAGVLSKTAGSGCSLYGGVLYAKDIVAYTSGEHFDVLIASGAMGGNGAATWNPDGIRPDITCPCPPGLWRAPMDPALYGFSGGVTPPPPGPTPTPAPDLSAILSRLDAVEGGLATLKGNDEAVVTSINELSSWRATVQTFVTETGKRLDTLEARPTVTGCAASVFGVPVSCRTRTPEKP